ncbi:MAG TPA: DNA-binding protein Alba [Candidatus Norongarragalinales archaeon]|jgi:DNA-binding protein Alba|nr:DNA-binding protein Alba [Candidatus Norongarragalinales archaeon]
MQITAPQEAMQDGDSNRVFVGKKNVMSYVLAVVTQFNNGASEVHLKARGKAISRAVDVTQITKNRFIPTLAIKDIRIMTEELTSEDGSVAKVSSMDILLTR